jgi:hypothetical protein
MHGAILRASEKAQVAAAQGCHLSKQEANSPLEADPGGRGGTNAEGIASWKRQGSSGLGGGLAQSTGRTRGQGQAQSHGQHHAGVT